MRFQIVNLDRSPERWAGMERDARALGLAVERVPAVDGRVVPREAWKDVDHRGFRLLHGRRILPGEYGCYRSHLGALEAVAASGEPVAIVCEDDVELQPAIEETVAAVLKVRPDLDLLKLVNHRLKGFVRHGGEGRSEFGRCIHGPQGSAACYAVTRAGAERLRRELAVMRLPYDVAFERGWALGAKVFTLRLPAVRFRAEASTIAPGGPHESYAASKPAFPFRLPTALFRAGDYARRAGYALR